MYITSPEGSPSESAEQVGAVWQPGIVLAFQIQVRCRAMGLKVQREYHRKDVKKKQVVSPDF